MWVRLQSSGSLNVDVSANRIPHSIHSCSLPCGWFSSTSYAPKEVGPKWFFFRKECFWSWKGFPGGSVVKNSPAKAGDSGSIPGWGSSPGGGTGNPLQYSCLENPMDRGAWWPIVLGVEKSQAGLSTHVYHSTTKLAVGWTVDVEPLSRRDNCTDMQLSGVFCVIVVYLHCTSKYCVLLLLFFYNLKLYGNSVLSDDG